MDIREAILKAADRIETNPSLLDWWNGNYRPERREEAVCPLCWIGSCIEPEKTLRHSLVAIDMLGLQPTQFYARCSDLLGMHGTSIIFATPQLWVTALRLYADLYHPAKPIQQAPDWRAMASGSVPADAVSQELVRT